MSMVGRVLGGRYEVGELIGHGGMAEVHLCRDLRLDRAVAVKILRPDLARDPHFLARFRREAQAAAGLTHPEVVAIFDSGQDESSAPDGSVQILPYIVMEYVEGETLRSILSREGRLHPDEAARITQGVLGALSYSHRMGIVHRDIKPGNVMLTRTGQIKVMDFGIARAVADSEATRTQTQAVMGTAQYLSPEQAQGQPVDARSDLYSAGCLLFELLTGRPPFVADTPVALAYQHVGQQPEAPSALVPDIPPEYDMVVLHALVKDREMRYQSAEEFADDLVATRSHRPVSAAAQSTAFFPDEPLPQTRADLRRRSRASSDTSTLPVADEEETGRRRAVIFAGVLIGVVAVLAVVAFLFAKGVWGSAAEQATVPYVVGQTQADASGAITAAGLKSAVTTTPDNTVERGHVISQDPRQNTRLDKGATVHLVVSAGPSQVVIPDVRGATQADATQTLGASSITVSQVVIVDDGSQSKGRVVGTEPAVGQTVPSGSSVVLKVASGNVVVPDLTLYSRSVASDMLAQLGLVLQPTFVVNDSVAPDSVLTQDPPANTSIPVGSRVKVTVSKASSTPTGTSTTLPSSNPTG